MKSLILIVLAGTSVFACLSVNKISTRRINQSGNTSLKTSSIIDTGGRLQLQSRFPIGAAVDPKRLYRDQQYANIVSTQFNSLTSENALKWTTVEPQQDQFNFNKGDSIVAFAQAHNMRVHGHVLVTVSSTSLPAWVNNFQGDKNAWETLFKNHIQGEVSHYKGKITSWDVVNETFDDHGNIRTTSQTGDNNIWLDHIGSDYTARAFQYAHEADPNALLFYNDNKQEINGNKLNAIINMVNDFKRRGIPINGLGVQMHININTPNEGIENALKRLAQTGLLIHISELDIRINPKNDFSIDSASSLKAQADKYYFVAHAYSTIIPKAQQYGITFWNVTDKDSWITLAKHAQDSPLLFDKNYNEKPAYKAFSDGLRN